MSLDLYRVENGIVALNKLAENGGWGNVANFSRSVFVTDYALYNEYVWWIVGVTHFEVLNSIPKEVIERSERKNVCLVSPPTREPQRYAVLTAIDAIYVSGIWYITEKAFDEAMTHCFGDYEIYLNIKEKL